MRIALLIVLMTFTNPLALAWQTPAPPRRPDATVGASQITDLPIKRVRITFPKLSLQRALRKAEARIRKEKINLGSYYLEEAKLIYMPDGADNHWYFRWMNFRGVLGDYVEIVVRMDGNASRKPSM